MEIKLEVRDPRTPDETEYLIFKDTTQEKLASVSLKIHKVEGVEYLGNIVKEDLRRLAKAI